MWFFHSKMTSCIFSHLLTLRFDTTKNTVMTPRTAAQGADRYFIAVVALFTFFTFLPAVQNEFVNWDDINNLALNQSYRGLGLTQLKWMWTAQLMGRYVPITWMTLGLDYIIWGMNPFGYHLTSVLFHTVNAVLFYFVALAVLTAANQHAPERDTAIQYGALFGTLLFAVHPLRVESVAWVTERRDVVSGMFYLLSILAYVKAKTAHRLKPVPPAYFASFGFFVLAVLSKEMAVTLPLVLLILDWYPLRRPFRTIWLEKIPFLAVSLADGILAVVVGTRHAINIAPAGFGWWPRVGEAFYSLAFYLWKTVAPFHLAPFYPFAPQKIDPARFPLEASIATGALLTAAAILLRRKYPALLAVWLAYVVTLAPVLGIIYNGLEITADRYSYLPCLGWALIIGSIIGRWSVGKRPLRFVVPAVAGIVVIVLGLLARNQLRMWHDSETLWTYTLSVEPSYLAHTSLGSALIEKGDYLWACEHFERAITLQQDYWLAHFDRAGCLGRLGRWNEATSEYRTTLTLNLGPSKPDVEDALGYSLMMEGKLDEAIVHFRQALELRPDYAHARNNLGLALIKKEGVP